MAATGDRPGLAPAFRWCSAKDFYYRSREKAEYTHTLFNGGLLNIPDDHYDEFLKRLAKDMMHGHHYFLNEIASEVTALYVDCDFEDRRTNENNDLVTEVVEDDLTKERHKIDREIAEQDRLRLAEEKAAAAEKGSDSPPLPPIFVPAPDDDVVPEGEVRKPPSKRRGREIDVEVKEVGAPLSQAFIFKFVQALQRCVFDYFPDITRRDDYRLTCIVLTTPQDKFKVETETRWNPATKKTVRTHRITSRKSGLHIVWPWLYATQTDMLDLREGFLRTVGQVCGDRPNWSNSWESVIDKQIYLPVPSLRMVNCDKIERCPDCKRSTQWRIKCARCQGAPPEANRVYRPEYSFNGEGSLTTHAKKCLGPENTLHMLRMCTIRRPGICADDIHYRERAKLLGSGITVFKVPDDAPRYDGIRHSYKVPKNGDKSSGSKNKAEHSLQQAETRGRVEFNKRREVRRVDRGSALHKQVQDFLRSAAMPRHYRDIVVNSIVEYEFSGNRYYMVRVTGNGSKFCQNVDREHGSRRIYFHLTRSRGCQQRCFCTCEEAKPGQIPPSVLCKHYWSPGVALTRALDVALFPRETAVLDRERQRMKDRPALMAVGARPDSSYMFSKSNGRSGVKRPRKGADERNVQFWNGDEGEECDGTAYEFDAADPTCTGMRKRPTPPSTSAIAAEDARRQRHRITQRTYAGDGSIIDAAPPPGMQWIPTDSAYAPANKAEARRMLHQAQRKERRRKLQRFDHGMYELMTGDFQSSTI